MRALLALLFVPGVVCANALPPCWPADAKGTGSPVVIRAGVAGLAYAWRCPTGQIQSVAGPWSAFVPTFEQEARRLAAGTDADRQAGWKKHVTRTAPLSAGVVRLRDSAVADVKTRHK